MIGGLKPGQRKMSKSDPENAIFMEDSEQDVERKINWAFCIEGVSKNNPVLEFSKFFIFWKYGKFILNREDSEQVYESYDDLERDFVEMRIKAKDLKMSLSR